MNFLLHMIGQAHREMAGTSHRPSGRPALLHRAARALTQGRFADALLLRKQADNAVPRTRAHDCIHGHLHLNAHAFAKACAFFERGLALGDDHDSPQDVLERQIGCADAHLRNGRYVLATSQLQRARNAVDAQLAANAGLLVASARLQGDGPPSPQTGATLIALSKLGDLLLRMLARTHLAANVARSLRDRDLREDLAPWATTCQSVDHLLQAEFDSLQRISVTHPDHAENNYRLGLVARSLDQLEAAAQAFTRVVTIHPHHVLAAARLSATLIELDRAEASLPILSLAFAVPPETLARYHQLATAADDHRTFEKAVARMCEPLASPAERTTAKANLAFALGEMGLLDQELATWTEPALSPQITSG